MTRFSPIARCIVCLLGLLGSVLPAQAAGNESGGFDTPKALVVPIEGTVNFRMVALLRRGLSEADSIGATRLILDIDTPGGEVAKMKEMIAMLEQLKDRPVDTVAFVRNQALSAGAVLALACKRIWVSPRATIGAAVPMYGGGLKNMLEDEVYSKMISSFRAEFKKIAAHHGTNVQTLAEAMVDERMEILSVRYRDDSGLIQTKILESDEVARLKTTEGVEVLSETGFGTKRPLVLDASEAVAFNLAEGTVPSLDALAQEFGIAKADVARISTNWSEELAGFLYSIRMFLMIGGVLMTVIALKAPGTGVPEALAILCFVFFFAGQLLVGLAAWTEILLFAGGIALVLVEFFVLPGTIVAGVLGFLCVVAALFLSLQSFGLPSNSLQDEIMTYNLTSLLVAILVVTVLAFVFSRFLPYIPFFNKLMLDAAPSDGELSKTATQERVASPLVGKRGTVITDLRPAGRIEIGGEPYDVVANGGFHDAGTLVEVLDVEGNRIVVAPVSQIDNGQSGLIAVHWLIFMLFCGLLAIIAEIFFVSFGVLGIVASVLTVSSVFLAFEHGTTTGSIFLGAVLVLVPVAIVFAFRVLPNTPIGKRLILTGPTGKSTAAGDSLKDMVGKRGTSVTPLRPVGTIVVEGRRFDAMTRGEGLERDVPVEVLRVELGQLVVRSANGST